MHQHSRRDVETARRTPPITRVSEGTLHGKCQPLRGDHRLSNHLTILEELRVLTDRTLALISRRKACLMLTGIVLLSVIQNPM